MNIKQYDINKLTPYKNNPRINDDAVEAVANSIKEFGFKQPIVIDRSNNVIVGHTRLKSAKKLGMATVPVVIADDLTDEQIKAYRLADNKTGEIAEWNFDLLEEELKGLFEVDMSDFGFEFDEKPSLEEKNQDSQESGERLSFDVTEEQAQKIRYCLYLISEGNEDVSKGEALTAICEWYEVNR